MGRRRVLIPRNCQMCERAFQPSVSAQKYCSPECAHKANGIKSRAQHPVKTCAHCGKEFEHKRKDTSGKYCSRACSDAVNKNPPAQPWIDKACAYCGEPFKCPPWNPVIAHCSVKCAKMHEAQTKRGVNHPLYKEKTAMTCEVCGKVCMVKPSLVSRFRACSRRCACVLGHQAWPRISSIEKAMHDAFLAIGLTPAAQYTVGGWVVDFAFPGARLAVECDGTYWHGTPHQQLRDRQKDASLKERGWHILRLSETDINASPADCAQRVQSLLSHTETP